MWGKPEHILVCYTWKCNIFTLKLVIAHWQRARDTCMTLMIVHCRMHACFMNPLKLNRSPWLCMALKHIYTSMQLACNYTMHAHTYVVYGSERTYNMFIVMGGGIHCIVLVCVLALILPFDFFNFSSFIDASALTTSLLALPSSVISSVA